MCRQKVKTALHWAETELSMAKRQWSAELRHRKYSLDSWLAFGEAMFELLVGFSAAPMPPSIPPIHTTLALRVPQHGPDIQLQRVPQLHIVSAASLNQAWEQIKLTHSQWSEADFAAVQAVVQRPQEATPTSETCRVYISGDAVLVLGIAGVFFMLGVAAGAGATTLLYVGLRRKRKSNKTKSGGDQPDKAPSAGGEPEFFSAGGISVQAEAGDINIYVLGDVVGRDKISSVLAAGRQPPTSGLTDGLASDKALELVLRIGELQQALQSLRASGNLDEAAVKIVDTLEQRLQRSLVSRTEEPDRFFRDYLQNYPHPH
jgi:hypothetical protein